MVDPWYLIVSCDRRPHLNLYQNLIQREREKNSIIKIEKSAKKLSFNRLTKHVFVVVAFMIVIVEIHIIVFDSISRLPGHLVLLLESSSSVGEPRRHLRQRHLGDDGEHYFLALCRIWILLMLLEPCLKSAGGFACRIFSSCAIQVHWITVKTQSWGFLFNEWKL